MREAFIETLFELACKDKRIILVVGDLGFGVVTRFMKELPHQFVNAGIAEQNMTGISAGMALSGKIVFTYSIANFPVLRCLEQIRNDICYHNANVKIVTVGGGMAYGSLGPSHHATEDIAVMRALPNLSVIAPNDPAETAEATIAATSLEGPCYLRLGRSAEPRIHKEPIDFKIGKAITVREGKDLTLIATGGMLENSLRAAELLAKFGWETRILSMHTIKPIDVQAVISAAQHTSAVFTVEEHSITGGLGGAVAEILMESEWRPRFFRRIGLDGCFSSKVGDQCYLRSLYCLDAVGIANTVKMTLSANPPVK